MGCQHHEKMCVCKIVKKIIAAQQQVNDDRCDVSCEKSISDLLSPTAMPDKDTVPFVLICKDACGKGSIPSSFGHGFGSGVFEGSGFREKDGCIFPVHSIYFRAKKMVKGTDCCAVLELLKPKPCNSSTGSHHKDHCEGIETFIRTGICITVDLNCFCGITCLPAVKTIKKH